MKHGPAMPLLLVAIVGGALGCSTFIRFGASWSRVTRKNATTVCLESHGIGFWHGGILCQSMVTALGYQTTREANDGEAERQRGAGLRWGAVQPLERANRFPGPPLGNSWGSAQSTIGNLESYKRSGNAERLKRTTACVRTSYRGGHS